MTKQLAEPTPTAAELRKQLKETEAREREATTASAKAIPIKWEWVITWKSAHVFHCGKRLTEATKKAIRNWEDRHNTSFPFIPYRGIDTFEGMNYVLIGNMLVQVGGGTLVLKATQEGNDHFSHEPRELAPDEEAGLREGNVPNSLKM